MGAAKDLDLIRKNEDALEIEDAVNYLRSIGVRRISAKTLRNRICLGTGPARFKRSNRWYFKKVDLDAWKKQETDVFSAYQK